MSSTEAAAEKPEPEVEEDKPEEEEEEEENSPPPIEKKPTPAVVTNEEVPAAPQGVTKRAQRSRRVKITAPVKQTNSGAASPTKKAATKKQEAKEEGDEYDDYVESDSESEGPSKVAAWLTSAVLWILGSFTGCVRALWSLLRRVLCGVVCTVRNICPVAFNTAFFFVVVYLTATYLISPAEPSEVATFTAKLRYIGRGHAWTLLPIVLGYVVSRWKRTDVHRRFADEVFRQGALLTINLAVFATHASAEDIHWGWSLTFVSSVYSLLYWISLTCGGGFLKKALSQPPLVALTVLTLRNFFTIVGQDTGYIVVEQTEEMAPQADQSGWFAS